MKRYIFSIILLLFLFSSSFAASEATLVKVAKADGRDDVQIFFSFTDLPKYSVKEKNKRVDIIFEKTSMSPDLDLFEADERIIKVLPSQHGKKTVISLFFRYRPQDVKLVTSKDGKLVCDVLLGNQYSRSYKNISKRLKGLTVVDSQPTESLTPLTNSPYRNNWKKFIRDYEEPVTIEVPINFTAPPFPVISLIPPGFKKNINLLSEEIRDLARQGTWGDIPHLILEQLKSTPDTLQQKLLALTYGEVLLREDDFEGAYKQLYLLKKEYPTEHVGIVSSYLLTLLESRFHDQFVADFDYRKLEDTITPNSSLAPYFLMSRIETAFATKQYGRMKQLLANDDVALPREMHKLKELRLGDYYNVTDQAVKSFIIYEQFKNSDLLKSHPASLNAYCGTLYNHHKYAAASACYRELGPQISDNTTLAMVAFRKAMADLHITPDQRMTDSFARIEDAFPGTEAGFKAAIKRTDRKYLFDQKWGDQAVKYYRALAKTSVVRPTVAEATIKEAVMHTLLGNKKRSVEIVMDFLRNFKKSDLRSTAYALLLDNLPDVIRQMIDEEQYMEALVLAKKNREVFRRNWLDKNILVHIAKAYQRVGIFSEAQKFYLYLLEVSDVVEREQYFLPLIQSTFDQGRYGLVEDFSSQYFYNYPEGKDSEAVQILRIRSFITQEKYDEAQQLLPEERSNNRELQLLTALIHFNKSEYGDVVEVLVDNNTDIASFDLKTIYMLAESKFNTGRIEESAPLFTQLAADEQYFSYATYRLAEIERKRGNVEKGLNLFKKIVEKKGESVWKRYAEKELDYSNISATLNKMIGVQ